MDKFRQHIKFNVDQLDQNSKLLDENLATYKDKLKIAESSFPNFSGFEESKTPGDLTGRDPLLLDDFSLPDYSLIKDKDGKLTVGSALRREGLDRK